MTRKQKLVRMILSKRLKKYGSMFTPPGTRGTLRKPMKFASLLRAQLQSQNTGLSGKDTADLPSEDPQVSESND